MSEVKSEKAPQTREDFEALIEKYKKINPEKYEMKKEELAKKLSRFPVKKAPKAEEKKEEKEEKKDNKAKK